MNNGVNNQGRRKTDGNMDNYDYGHYDVNAYENAQNNNQDKRFSEPVDNTTMIGFSANQPMGLDMNSFANDFGDQTMHSVSTSNDLPIIAEVRSV